MAEGLFIAVLALVNLTAGVWFAFAIARRMAAITGSQHASRGHVLWLVGVYFLECVAFAAGMATQVFTIGLGVVWGLAFGFWLGRRAAGPQVTRTLVLIGGYTSLPSASLGVLLLSAKLLEGADPLSTAAGAALGIPSSVPWPLNTLLGFCLALSLGTLAIKVLVTAVVGSFAATRGGGRRDSIGAASGRA